MKKIIPLLISCCLLFSLITYCLYSITKTGAQKTLPPTDNDEIIIYPTFLLDNSQITIMIQCLIEIIIIIILFLIYMRMTKRVAKNYSEDYQNFKQESHKNGEQKPNIFFFPFYEYQRYCDSVWFIGVIIIVFFIFHSLTNFLVPLIFHLTSKNNYWYLFRCYWKSHFNNFKSYFIIFLMTFSYPYVLFLAVYLYYYLKN